ncbi:MAG: hypothetical protein ACYS8W_01290 [Planctomycetota bacterium]|jgi:uncharacterized protein YjeT (DUF2065 family)
MKVLLLLCLSFIFLEGALVMSAPEFIKKMIGEIQPGWLRAAGFAELALAAGGWIWFMMIR